MVTDTLVEPQIDSGQRLLDRLAAAGFVVRSACWIKPPDDGRWSLYIATPAVDQVGPLEAYGRVTRVIQSLGDVWISSNDVKLVSEHHPLVRDSLDLLRSFPHRRPISSPRSLLGGQPVEEVYVYPSGKAEVTIYGMSFRGEPGGALHLSFEPHNPSSELTVESGGQRTAYPAETGIDWLVAAPEGAALERDDNGRTALVWDLHGTPMKSSALEVWTFARLGLHGFRFLREPHEQESAACPHLGSFAGSHLP